MCHVITYKRPAGLKKRWPRFSDITGCKYSLYPQSLSFLASGTRVNVNMCGYWWREGGPGTAETMANLSWPYQPPFTFVMQMMLHACVTVWLSPGMKIPHVAHHTWLMLAVVTAHCSSRSWGATQIAHLQSQTNRERQSCSRLWGKKERQKLIATLTILQRVSPWRGWPREGFSAFCSRATNKRQTLQWQAGIFKDYHKQHKAVDVSFRFLLQKM